MVGEYDESLQAWILIFLPGKGMGDYCYYYWYSRLAAEAEEYALGDFAQWKLALVP